MNNNGLSKEKIINNITLDDILNCRITEETPIKELEPIIQFKESVFCATNELSFISGKPKAGKTSVASVMLSVCLTPNPNFDTLGMSGKYCEGKTIIYIDSEQSKRSSKNILERIKRNLDIEKAPENLFLYNFRHFGNEELKKAFEMLLEYHKDVFLWFLDGISDMVKSVNNEEEASFLIKEYLNSKVEEKNTAMILFLHENSASGNEKMRGHLGSEAQRKCYSTISISKDRKTQTHSIKSIESRDGKNFEEIFFRFDETTKRMVTLQGEEYNEAKKKGSEVEELWELGSLMTIEDKFTSKVLHDKIMNRKGWGKNKAIDKVKEAVSLGVFIKEEKSKNEVYYYLHNSKLLNSNI
ncbi:MAG: hypothetical protein MUC49_13065 [Raineya sp.]|jgi:hypothetical protein|nr:hypothetical protein [Raineya sp.]